AADGGGGTGAPAGDRRHTRAAVAVVPVAASAAIGPAMVRQRRRRGRNRARPVGPARRAVDAGGPVRPPTQRAQRRTDPRSRPARLRWPGSERSEERRVGKGGRSGWGRGHWQETKERWKGVEGGW